MDVSIHSKNNVIVQYYTGLANYILFLYSLIYFSLVVDNIDFLYEIPVVLGSDSENGENQQEVAAKKSRSIEIETKKRKEENLKQEDSIVVKKVPLFCQGGN